MKSSKAHFLTRIYQLICVKETQCLSSEIILKVKKGKCAHVQALRISTGLKDHRGSRGTDVLFRDHGTRRSEWSASLLRKHLTWKEKVPIVKEAGEDKG